MEFQAGQSGNPAGRPKGSYGGRIMALAGLDRLLARKKNQKALIAALERDLQDNPIRFFKTVIMPLLPRESKLSFDHEGVIQWRSLLGASAEPVGGGRCRVEGEEARPACVAEAMQAKEVPSLPASALRPDSGQAGSPQAGGE